MQISVLKGIYTDANSDFRNSLPRNLIPVPKQSGVSNGYLRPADGIVSFATDGPGIDRGGIKWRDKCYRVMGSKLVSVSSTGVITTIGDVGAGGQVRFDYSFDYLGINSGTRLYLYNGVALTQITDADLGVVKDFIWVDGYFMTTDGTYLIVTELNDPFSVLTLKYGSSEIDPDSVVGLAKVSNLVHAINRNTIEVFQNIGGLGFPFQRIAGAQIPRGVVGSRAFAPYLDGLAFIGGGRNEKNSVWLGSNGQSARIATREVDQILSEYTEAQLSAAVCETRIDEGHQLLYIHLEDQALVYDGAASLVVGEPIWFTLGTSLVGKHTYKARNLVWCYDKWIVGDPTNNRVGYFTSEISSHYGDLVGWDFGTVLIYNESKGAIVHSVELICLTGRGGDDSTVWTQYTLDGMTWSQERGVSAGKRGERDKRIIWMRCGSMKQFRGQRFRGTSDAHLSIVRLEAELEPLNV